MTRAFVTVAAMLATAAPAALRAADISTHVLDLASGTGGANIPALLERRGEDGAWTRIAAATTDANGRVRSFVPSERTPAGTYRITFDMRGYRAGTPAFFPEIAVVFQAGEAAGHYHVPVAVSPFGYSTYRGN